MVTVDVLVVAYNQETFIAEAINSIIRQVVSDDISVRIVISDDCSSDSTLKVIQEYESKSPYPFSYIQRDSNLGIAKSYQVAFQACSGDYVAILEGDDFWIDNDKIQKHVTYLNRHPECVLSVNGRAEYDQAKRCLEFPDEIPTNTYISLAKSILNYDLIRNLSTCVFRTSALHSLNPLLFDAAMRYDGVCTDTFIVHDVLQHGYAFRFMEVMSAYRVNTGYNASFKHKKTKAERIEWLTQMYADAQRLLTVDYSACFKRKLSDRILEINDYYDYYEKEKRKRFIPPCLVELSYKLPSLFKCIKRVLRSFVPNAVHQILKQKLNRR